jgi:hypothetical protein
VLAEEVDGDLVFLDTGSNLNQRIDEILPQPTRSGLVDAVEAEW